jgi:multiple sugar transport system permease protein
VVLTHEAPARAAADRPAPRRRSRLRGPERTAGWLFVSPVVVLLFVFLLVPILMGLWVSFTSWNGQGSPFQPGVPVAGASNYTKLFTVDGLARQDLMTSLRNNIYYVAIVVPLQTVLALFLALVVNQRILRAKSFFRTGFYFPSITSSVAVSMIVLFLFTNGGAINAILGYFGIDGPNWFADSRGVLHLILNAIGVADINNPPPALLDHQLLGLSWWEWFAGPSVGLCAIIGLVIWTTSGTFMLMFLAALQGIPVQLEEASLLDGANRWQHLRRVTLPLLKPTMFLVVTLGLIGTWQVFDQVYVITKGGPSKTTVTPAYLSYRTAFLDFNYGPGAAISFILFAIIIVMMLFQRWVMRDRDRTGPGWLRRTWSRSLGRAGGS